MEMIPNKGNKRFRKNRETVTFTKHFLPFSSSSLATATDLGFEMGAKASGLWPDADGVGKQGAGQRLRQVADKRSHARVSVREACHCLPISNVAREKSATINDNAATGSPSPVRRETNRRERERESPYSGTKVRESNEPRGTRRRSLSLALPTRMILRTVRPMLMVMTAMLLETSGKPRLELPRNCAHSAPSHERSATISANGSSGVATMTILEELESRLSRLERRLRAVEQPVWQMSSAEEDWEICAEGPCKCQPETKSVSCWRQNLLDLPAAQLVPRDVLKLDLAGNRLTALHRDTFLDMTRLNHLDLSDNAIEHLPLNLFFSLHAVTRIRLSKNLLVELHRSQFLSTRNLRILDASSNRLRTLPESLFLSTTSLVLLDLSCNRLSSFAPETFRGLSSLEELLLGKNRLSILPVDLFKDLTSLKYLGLEENRLKELPDLLFRAQSSLRELNARGNQLTEISASLLSPLERLRSLELSNNKIARIDSSALQGLAALKELQLGHNRIRNLTPGLFTNSTGLERLVLYANGIESLSRGTFHGLSNLTSLFLHSNHLRILHPELFDDTPNLRKLQLESNYLSSLPPRIFDGVQSMEQLRLARNPWHCDCAASYLAMWLQRMYLAQVNATRPVEDPGVWEFGAGAVCRGPGTLGGKLLLRLTFHELCEGQWASMRGLVPRLPIDLIGSGRTLSSTDDPFARNESNFSRSLAKQR